MTLLPERKIAIPEWLPADRRDRLRGARVLLRINRGVRSRLRTPEWLPPSEWNERYRVMGAAESFPGRWRRDIAPHAGWVMDLWALPWVREVWFCGPDQASKTSSILGCLGSSIDQDPGNIFYTASNEDKSKEIVNDKLIPMLRESPRLRKRLSRRMDDTGMCKIRMNNGVTIRVAWANSPASTASFSARYTFTDELDKCAMVGSETSIVRRIRKRAKNYPLTYKHFFASTPAGRYIYKGMLDCQQIWTHAARCPDCGDLVVMDEEHMVIPAGATSESIKGDPAAVQYACNACGALWDEEKRLSAYRNGDKYCIKGADIPKPMDIGIHLTGFVTPDMRLADIAITMIQAKGGDLAARIDLAHGIKCIDYKEEKADRSEDSILRLVDPHLPRAVVPPDTSTIIIKADTQQSGFFYQVLAFGYGSEPQPALIDHGFLETFDQLREKGEESLHDAQGTEYRAHAGFIDSGGGTNPYKPKHSRTSEVYEFCRANKFWRPVKGRRAQATPWSITRLDFFPSRDGKKRPIPGGLNLYTINVTLYKNQLATKLAINPGDPGAIRLHAGVLEDGPHSGQKYAAQLCAEYRDDRGYWECPPGKANHFWDCWVYGFAAADILGVRRKKKPEPVDAEQPEPMVKQIGLPGGFVGGWNN